MQKAAVVMAAFPRKPSPKPDYTARRFLRELSRELMRLLTRLFMRVLILRLLRALERTSLVEAGATGVLATIAFFVVFKVLMSDFFWIVIKVSLASFFGSLLLNDS